MLERELYVCQGLGDIFWVYQKMAPNYDVLDFNICILKENQVQRRSVDWLKCFPKVRHVKTCLTSEGKYYNLSRRRSKYHDRWYCVNRYLEEGNRLEQIAGPTQWNIQLKETQVKVPNKYLTCFVSGARKVALWQPCQWIELIQRLYVHYRLPILFLGAEYDKDMTLELAYKSKVPNETFIDYDPAKVIYILKNSSFHFGYQCGLNVIADNYKVPQLMLYYPELRKMMYSWCQPDHRKAMIFRANTFDRTPEEVYDSFTPPEL
jgi:hypothetical protein